MTANSGAFSPTGLLGRKNVDLLQLLDKSNLPFMFFALLGDRLKFKDLGTKKWVNGNDKYDTISILDPPTVVLSQELSPKPTIKKHTHDRNVNHSKQMINRYLDGEIGFPSLVDYTLRGLRENADFAIDFRSALNKVLTNHRNKIQKQDHKKLEKLSSALRQNMNQKKWIKVRLFLAMLL